MANPSSSGRPQMGGGALLAISILLGVIIGAAYHQASVGFLVGLVVGITILLIQTLIDKRRRS